MIEIGSYARGEQISCSDHDLRLMIHCQNPLYVFDEETWTERPADNRLAFQEWGHLNQSDRMTFGLTNLAYIEAMFLMGRFTLVDHTCLYQGRILMDEAGAVETFRTRYTSVRYANIVSTRAEWQREKRSGKIGSDEQRRR